MNIHNYDKNNLMKTYEDVANKNIYNDKINNNIKKDTITVSLQNVDSRDRNINPKNIIEKNYDKLTNNPMTTSINQNIIKIYLPNHDLETGDFITINNVQSFNKDLFQSLFLMYNFNFCILFIPNHNINNSYKSYVDKLYLNITEKLETDTHMFDNIPKNMIIGRKEIYTMQDIIDNSIIDSDIFITNIQTITNFNNIDLTFIHNNFLFISLDYEYYGSNVLTIPSIYNIEFLHAGGISINQINSNYPLSFQFNEGYKEIINSTTDYIYIQTKSTAFSNTTFGGSDIYISKISKTLQGYNNPANCSIQLFKNYINVTKIEMISSEFPISNYIINKDNNSKLYWKLYNTGDQIYSLSINSGNYTITNLINSIVKEFNDINYDYNILTELSIDIDTNNTIFKFFELVQLPNSINISYSTINNRFYYKVTIKHPNNYVSIDDTIEITNCEDINHISSNVFNQSHKITEIDNINQTYSFYVPFLDESLYDTEITDKGGVDIVIKVPTKVQLLFNYKDTLGDVIGFKNSSETYSITEFKKTISNQDNYMYPEINQYNNLLNLKNNNYYWLLYINDYEHVVTNSEIPNAFAKILLDTEYNNNVAYNTFVNDAVIFEKPIPNLNTLDIVITDPQGNIVNFFNNEYSFTLRIHELTTVPIDSGKLSKNYSYIKTLINDTS